MSTDLPAESTAAIARRLANEAPEAMLPCPACANEVRGRNLDEHLSRVHELSARAADGAEISWRATDRRMERITLIPVVLWLVGLAFVPDDPVPGGVYVEMLVWAAGFVAVCTPVALAFMGKFSATLTAHSDRLELRHALSLLRTRVDAPYRLQTGDVMERREDNLAKDGYGYRGPSEDVHVGTYLRVTGANGRQITIGSPKGQRLRKYWEAPTHEQGPARRMLDVQFTPSQLVQLQYQLAGQSVLHLRVHDLR